MITCQCDKHDGRVSKGCDNAAYVDCHNMMPGNTVDLVMLRRGTLDGEYKTLSETRVTMTTAEIDTIIDDLTRARNYILQRGE